MITFSFKVFFMERITSTTYLEPLDLEGQVRTLPREWIPILQTSETIMLNILCFSWVEDTSTQNGGTERFRFWSQLRKLGFHPWPGAKQIYNLQAVNNFNGCCIWLFYNKIGAVAQCPNNWGVGSAFHRMKIHNLNWLKICLDLYSS